jgi:hypothetical protein
LSLCQSRFAAVFSTTVHFYATFIMINLDLSCFLVIFELAGRKHGLSKP